MAHDQAEGITQRYSSSSAGAFAKYTTGPIAVGLARTEYEPSQTIGTDSIDHYKTDMYGVQFAVNDALSLSVSEEKSTSTASDALTTSDVEMKIQHYQAAYVIGGATLGLAVAEADNSDYTKGKNEKTTVLSVAMAF